MSFKSFTLFLVSLYSLTFSSLVKYNWEKWCQASWNKSALVAPLNKVIADCWKVAQASELAIWNKFSILTLPLKIAFTFSISVLVTFKDCTIGNDLADLRKDSSFPKSKFFLGLILGSTTSLVNSLLSLLCSNGLVPNIFAKSSSELNPSRVFSSIVVSCCSNSFSSASYLAFINLSIFSNTTWYL